MSGERRPSTVLPGSNDASAYAIELAAQRVAKGESLWDDAWRRLKRNRMAMVGLVVTVVMGLVSILAGVISPHDPANQQLWTGALPPMSRLLSLRNEMRFKVGERPVDLDVPRPVARVLGDGREHHLRFDVQEKVSAPVRVVASGGVIERIEVRPEAGGVLRPERLELIEGESLQVPATPVSKAVPLAERELAVQGPIPAGVAVQEGRYVVSLELVTRSPETRYPLTVRFDGEGAVLSVVHGEKSLDGTTMLEARDVADVALDGAKLTHLHVLGTDLQGRDTLSRLIYGGQISLLVGLTATIVSLLIGVIYGAVSGYLGGRVDAFMMRTVDVLFGIPYMFLVILLLVTFGRSIVVLFIALGAVQWLMMARIVRGQVLSLREKEFVEAAVTVGTGTWGILHRHLIPNVLGVVVVYTTLTVPAVILQESFLAFLGLSVEVDGQPLESWGALVNYGREALGGNGEFWWLLVWPALAMSITLFSLNFLGDGLRDALDPQQRGRT